MPPRTITRPIQPPSPDQVGQLLAAARSDPDLAAFVFLAAATGAVAVSCAGCAGAISTPPMASSTSSAPSSSSTATVWRLPPRPASPGGSRSTGPPARCWMRSAAELSNGRPRQASPWTPPPSCTATIPTGAARGGRTRPAAPSTGCATGRASTACACTICDISPPPDCSPRASTCAPSPAGSGTRRPRPLSTCTPPSSPPPTGVRPRRCPAAGPLDPPRWAHPGIRARTRTGSGRHVCQGGHGTDRGSFHHRCSNKAVADRHGVRAPRRHRRAGRVRQSPPAPSCHHPVGPVA
jgi:hypothetical protein